MSSDGNATQFARLVGAVFLAVGVLGFIPGVTSNFSDITFASHESDAELLGIFGVNILHNIVHLGFGVAGLVMANSGQGRTFLIYGGALYLVVWIYGLVIDLSSNANFIALNTADNWLHLFLGVGMIALGMLAGRPGTRTATA